MKVALIVFIFILVTHLLMCGFDYFCEIEDIIKLIGVMVLASVIIGVLFNISFINNKDSKTEYTTTSEIQTMPMHDNKYVYLNNATGQYYYMGKEDTSRKEVLRFFDTTVNFHKTNNPSYLVISYYQHNEIKGFWSWFIDGWTKYLIYQKHYTDYSFYIKES